MGPAGRKKRIIAGIGAVAVCTALLAVGSTYGRLIDWTSTEQVYTPSAPAGYSSDLLIAGGQRIVLADWQPEETERAITIAINRPQTDQEPVLEPSEAVVTLDGIAVQHLTYEIAVEQTSIQVLLKRQADAPGLPQATELTATIAWKGLAGTLCINMQPYGTQTDPATGEDAVQRPEVVTGLTPVWVNDTANAAKPMTCVKLNLETLSDWTLTFTQNAQALPRVRWSMDGEHYSLLYDSNHLTVSWPYADGWDGTLYLDFSCALEPEQRPTIAVEATGYARQEFTPVLAEAPNLSQQIVKAVDLPQTVQISTTWGAAQMQIGQIQRLVTDADGNLVYETDAGLTAAVTSNGILLASADEAVYPEPGSYRMVVRWVWMDTVIEEQILYFFINTN